MPSPFHKVLAGGRKVILRKEQPVPQPVSDDNALSRAALEELFDDGLDDDEVSPSTIDRREQKRKHVAAADARAALAAGRRIKWAFGEKGGTPPLLRVPDRARAGR